MTTKEIVSLATTIKNTYKNKSVLDIIKSLNYTIMSTMLNESVYPAYTINYNGAPCIVINRHFNKKQQNILAAHELGHALLHKKNYYNQFGDSRNDKQEYEANLFAVALLFNKEDFNCNICLLDNYELKFILDYNIKKLKSKKSKKSHL